MTTVVTGTLHRIQRGHGRGFADEPPPVRPPVRRPARVAIMLALAHTIEKMICQGQLHDQADAARRLGLTRARVTQLLALLQLAPDVQERVLFLEAIDGVEPLTERDLRPISHVRLWPDQWSMLRSAGFDALPASGA